MGIVLKQSLYNTMTLALGFAIGGINVLFLYTSFLEEDYFGLVTFIFSTGNILLPLIVFGMQHTIIKFYSSYELKKDRDGFLTNTLLLPLLIIVPLGLIGMLFYETISNWLSIENPMIKNYTYLVFVVAVFMGYFEVFYAWTKVQLKSVFGGFIKEVFTRLGVTVLLVGVSINWLTDEEFIYALVAIYGLRMLIMMVYAFTVYKPVFKLKIPKNIKEIVTFSIYIIVAGSAGGILLEIDKFMIPQMEKIAEVAYYAVGIYIASVVAIPLRAMQQITTPITAQDMNTENHGEVHSLYKKTSINLLLVGCLLFLIINLNIHEMYTIINNPEFFSGIWIVMIISVAKLIDMSFGTGNAILLNSKYFKYYFYLSIGMAVSVIALNGWLISTLGIDGAALATLVVVLVFTLIKVIVIRNKFQMFPYSVDGLKLVGIVFVLYMIFRKFDSPISPYAMIATKTVLITALYIFLVRIFKISGDFNEVLKSVFRK